MPADLLASYLTDHLAGATIGSRRMRRLAEHERSAPDGTTLAAIATEIEQDRETLRRILDAAGVRRPRSKVAIAWVAERVGLLKSNGRLFRRTPLTSVVELEMMQMAVTGKRALWEALARTELADRFDVDGLIIRAEQHLKGLR
jgi:hypothetical protein